MISIFEKLMLYFPLSQARAALFPSLTDQVEGGNCETLLEGLQSAALQQVLRSPKLKLDPQTMKSFIVEAGNNFK